MQLNFQDTYGTLSSVCTGLASAYYDGWVERNTACLSLAHTVKRIFWGGKLSQHSKSHLANLLLRT